MDLTFRYYTKIRQITNHAASSAIAVLHRLHFQYLGRCEKRTGLTIASRFRKYERDLGFVPCQKFLCCLRLLLLNGLFVPLHYLISSQFQNVLFLQARFSRSFYSISMTNKEFLLSLLTGRKTVTLLGLAFIHQTFFRYEKG